MIKILSLFGGAIIALLILVIFYYLALAVLIIYLPYLIFKNENNIAYSATNSDNDYSNGIGSH